MAPIAATSTEHKSSRSSRQYAGSTTLAGPHFPQRDVEAPFVDPFEATGSTQELRRLLAHLRTPGAPMPALADVVQHLDSILRTAEVPDYPPALNGLQMENGGSVARVAAAVDFSLRAVEGAAAAGADLLIVHHGMFWGGTEPLLGPLYHRLALLVQHRIAVYASHLPLDVHPELGNNVLLARELGLSVAGGFGRFQTIDVGVLGECDFETADLVRRARGLAEKHGGTTVVTPHSSGRRTRRFGICTGAGASSETIREAVRTGIDTLIVGEGPHHTGVQAADAGLVIIYAGHYATETLGVRALAAHLERQFGMPWSFLDLPTGL